MSYRQKNGSVPKKPSFTRMVEFVSDFTRISQKRYRLFPSLSAAFLLLFIPAMNTQLLPPIAENQQGFQPLEALLSLVRHEGIEPPTF
jgi:hypothetical protein